MKLMNAGQASFPFAWHGYSACASYDRHYWSGPPLAGSPPSHMQERARCAVSTMPARSSRPRGTGAAAPTAARASLARPRRPPEPGAARAGARFRVPTQYDKEAGVLTITHIPEQDACQYAYFASYSYQRHQSMVADLQARDGVRLEMMGQTLDGHDLDVLIVGAPPPPDAHHVGYIFRVG